MIVHIDIESRSRVDLKARGVYNYAADPSTTILFISWAVDNEQPKLWFFKNPFPAELRRFFEDPLVIFKAHNAAFERLMFNHVLTRQVGTPEIPIERFYCTAVQARANALPDKLELCARALGAREQKDHRGARLIQLLSVPQKDGSFNKDPDLMAEFGEYCRQDVRTERSIFGVMRELTDAEKLDYIVSEEINDRGIMVDVEFAAGVTKYAAVESAQIKRQVSILTKGEVTTPGSPKFVTWVHERLPDAFKHIVCTTRNKSGYSFDQDTVSHLYEVYDDLPVECQKAITLKAMSAKSSISKFQGMVDRAGPDWRVRGAFVLYGAGQTHRYSSRGLQLHNMARDTAADPFEIRERFMDGDFDEEDIFRVLKSMVRPSIMPAPGKLLVCLDWAGIEARVLPWETADARAEKVLDIFRRGEDIYLKAAADIDQDRQVGKVATLALGYQGAVNAFQSMARNYGVTIEDPLAERVVKAWRRKNAWCTDWWRSLERAATMAVRSPGQQVSVGRVKYVYLGSGRQLPGTLFCILPSGTMLSYPQTMLTWNEQWEKHELTCLKASLRPKADDPQWPRMGLYGGLMAENITQAIAGDLLREALIRIREWSDEVVLHVHDEVVLEVPEDEADEAMEDLRNEMLVLPDWAEGLPLDVGGWIGEYYRKD